MADRTIDININITGSTAGGTGGKGTSSAQQREEAKRLTNQLKEEEKRRTIDHAAEVKKQAEDSKRAYKEQSDAAKKASKEQIAEVKKATTANSNTWANALKSYQFKFNALGNIISNVVSTATRMLTQLGSSVVTISKDFEFAMSGVKAITNATDKEFKELYSDAIRLGGATLFTAKEVAGLQEELAKLGFSVKEIRSATDGVVALAAATGEDLAQSALVAGTVIRGFGLDAVELTRVVDIMAQSFNDSALDLYKFSETMKYVAPVASKTGYSVAEITALMANLADQGVVASQAGTGLRNILLRLADANSKLSKAIGFSANSLPELILGFRKLNEAGVDATAALKLTDRYSITAVLALSQQTDKIWELYKSLVSTSGAAQKMSETRMDNFAGEIDKLKGAWDSFVLSLNKTNGALRHAVEGVRGFIEWMGKAIQGFDQKTSEAAGRLMRSSDTRLNNELANIDKKMVAELDALDKSEMTEKEKIIEFEKIQKDYDKKRKDARELETQTEKNLAEQKVKIYSEAVNNTIGKEKERAEESLDIYSKYLENINQRTSTERKNELIDAFEELENMTEAEKEKWMEIEKVRIESMKDGLEKELALKRLSYVELIKNAEHYGLSTKNIYDNMYAELDKIIQKYFTEEEKKELERIEKIADISLREEELKVFTARKVYQERLKFIAENIKDEKLLGELIADANKKLRESSDMQKLKAKPNVEFNKKPGPSSSFPVVEDMSIWDRLGVKDLTSEQMSALKRGFTFISDQIEELADKEKEMADLRVENSERVVDQLQKDLDLELQKMQAGYASNVTLKEKELADAKVRQAEALKLQEQAVKKQQQLEAMAQAISLITATANILKNYSALPVVGQVLAIAEIAAMWGTFTAAQIQAKKLTQYGEGGEIAGKKHSEGGVSITAEGGEYVVKASAYAKNKELVQAINNEDMSNVYRALNQDLSVSLDDSDTARMLGRHFKDKKKVTYFNGYRVEELGNRRRVIRYAKV